MKVEIGQYREVNKGSLKAFFSLVIHPEGQKILDCRYFVQGDNRWFSFPQKEIKAKDESGKSEWIPLISYMNKEYLKTLQDAVLEQLKDAKPMEYHGKKSDAAQGKTTQVQNTPPAYGF